MNKKTTKLRETSGYDELKTQAIDRFRSQDPMTLSNSELRSAIDYMLAYRWALNGDEDVLHEYIQASKIRNEDRHPSQNDLPPIDKFHPDWWYYRQEMEEPVDIDDNYKNESRYMNKKLIRLTENDLHRIVKESVNRIINEIGDTQRGQWMLGRLGKRQSDGGGKFNRGLSGINYASDRAYDANGGMYSKDYLEGYEDEGNNGRNADSTWDGNKYRRMQFNYDAKKMSDMDNVGKKFINFIEKYHGGVLLQTIVDYESGNQTGTPCSPLPTIISEFEDAVIGHKCTPEMRQVIKNAYNQWWVYAQDQLMPNE